MKKIDVDLNLFAPCGVDCSLCYVYLGMRKNGVKCVGCLNGDVGKPKHCKTCRIKQCITDKKISYCFECETFPCQKIKSLSNSYEKGYHMNLIERGFVAKESGIENILLDDKTKFTCRNCRGTISLQDNICSECHLEVNHED